MICVDFPVSFTTPSGPGFSAINWFWDFGDGNFSNLQNPFHTYTTLGQFSVTLLADDGINPPEVQIQQIFVATCTPIESSQGNWICYRS